jgi:hypothetical protein
VKKIKVNLMAAVITGALLYSGPVLAESLPVQATGDVGVSYRTHIQNEGWAQGWVSDGEMSGTEGQGLRLEGIEIELTGGVPDDLVIQYRTHIENKGWSQGWVLDGKLSGSEGEGLRLEAIEIQLTGSNASDYTIKYRTQIENKGWEDVWAADGELSGTEGEGLRLEAIEIVIAETPIKVAYDAYEEVLNQVNEEDYTSATWDVYQEVVAANVVTKEDIANKITEAAQNIEAAQADLVKKADLSIYYDILNSVSEEQCSPESWATYQEVVTANMVTEEDSQAAVDAATIAILKAQKGLVVYADLTAYNAVLAAITEDQVKSGWEEYEAVLEANQVTRLNDQAEVDAATAIILAAQKNLEYYSDLSQFNMAIAEYVEYGNDADNVPYTRESWDAYMAVCEVYGNLDNGKWVYEAITRESEQLAIDNAAAAIEEIREALVPTSDLRAFNAAKNISQDDGPYTATSFESYSRNEQVAAITGLSADLLKGYSQSVVDAYTQTLLAIQQEILVLAADMTAYNDAITAVDEKDYSTSSWAVYQAVIQTYPIDNSSSQQAVDEATSMIMSAQQNLIYSTAYVAANSKLNATNFGICSVGDNILTRATELISDAGFDTSLYQLSFTRIDEGSAVINAQTGEITDVGSGSAMVAFTISLANGTEAVATNNVNIVINNDEL